MNTSSELIHGAISVVLTLGAIGTLCAGSAAVAAAGDNQQCAGTAKVDRDAEAWIFVCKGSCEKIAGGSVTGKPHHAPGGLMAMRK